MKRVLLTIASLLISAQVMADKKPALPELPQTQYTVVGTVDLAGKQYQKVVKAEQRRMATFGRMASAPVTEVGLFEGDLIRSGELSLVASLNGKYFMSFEKDADIADIAASYNLKVEFTKGNLAIVKAGEGVELGRLLEDMTRDSRISMVNLEKVTNQMQPE